MSVATKNSITKHSGRSPGRFLSGSDLAAELGVVDRTIRRLIDDGSLRAHRFGRLVRIDREDADAYIAVSRR